MVYVSTEQNVGLTGTEVNGMVTMIKIFVKIIKLAIAAFKLSGKAREWVDDMEERYGIG